MTQSPQSGQTAPRSTEFGAVSAPPQLPATSDATSPASTSGVGTNGGHSGQWGSTSTSNGAPAAYPEAPTHVVPPVHTPPPPPPVRPIEPTPAAKANRAARARGPRRASLQLRHINPWTVLKFSCVLAIALFFVWLIVIGVLYGILDGAGAIGKINDAITTINGTGSKPPVTAGIVFGSAAIIGVVNIVLFIALSTVGSVVYNLCADLVGGIEITLSER